MNEEQIEAYGEEVSHLETDKNLAARIIRPINNFNNVFLVISGIGLFSVMFALVFIRYILRGDLVAMEEYLFFIAVWAVFLGSANGIFEKSHVCADTIAVLVKNRLVLKVSEFIRQLLTVLLAIAFAYYGFLFFKGSLELNTVTTILRLPFTIGHASIFYGTFFMAVYQIYHFIDYITGFIRENKELKSKKDKATVDNGGGK